jgi:HD-GYP domain-containing protein (c-di-GMP phosphodiesterase class II)
MSSDRPSDAPSPRAEGAGPSARAELDLASLLRLRGGPLVEALEHHLPGAREHAEATASYAFAGAVGLGFDRAQCEVAREAAMLHEVGLIYVPAAIAAKPEEQRDDAETAAWAEHYEAGYRLARGAGIPEHACSWLLRVREHYDGSGPEQFAGDRIPLESRLIRAACRCQTALASSPASGEKAPLRVAIEALTGRAGAELDPRVVAALTAILERSASG